MWQVLWYKVTQLFWLHITATSRDLPDYGTEQVINSQMTAGAHIFCSAAIRISSTASLCFHWLTALTRPERWSHENSDENSQTTAEYGGHNILSDTKNHTQIEVLTEVIMWSIHISHGKLALLEVNYEELGRDLTSQQLDDLWTLKLQINSVWQCHN